MASGRREQAESPGPQRRAYHTRYYSARILPTRYYEGSLGRRGLNDRARSRPWSHRAPPGRGEYKRQSRACVCACASGCVYASGPREHVHVLIPMHLHKRVHNGAACLRDEEGDADDGSRGVGARQDGLAGGGEPDTRMRTGIMRICIQDGPVRSGEHKGSQRSSGSSHWVGGVQMRK